MKFLTVNRKQHRRPHHSLFRGRGLDVLEPRTLLAVLTSPTPSTEMTDALANEFHDHAHTVPDRTVQIDGMAGLPEEIHDPASFVWTYVSSPEPHYVGVMEYGEATFSINGQTLTTRAYRQQGGEYSIPGPTLNMVPGNKYVLRFRNLLPYEQPSSVHNDFKDPNITNVHTHGLHISGESPGDDVIRMFEGGFGGDYVYDIPADHMGGTFWYHAHHHGSTFLQVSTGGFGFIIIDDSQDQIPANVAVMEERLVLIGYLDSNAAGTGGDTLVSGTFQPGWTVNGTVNGNLMIPPDTWQHWRVLLADADARPKDVTIGANCESKLLARDGVWRTSAPKDLPTGRLNLTGASRADLAIRCTGNSVITVGNTNVANIVVAGVADPGPHPYAADGVSMWSASRPAYLRDLRAESDVHTERINMGARTINGQQFDVHTPGLVLNADSVQEWTLQGAANHPFHLHVYHVQAPANAGDFEAGEYYDTFAANGSVRFDLNAATSSPLQGRTIMHCHILEHEDQGAMTWMDVVGGTPPPTFPAGHGYDPYYALLIGDFNSDGVLNLPDIDLLVAEIAAGSNSIFFDLTGDQAVDLDDRDAWLAIAGAANLPSGNSYLLGDANLDGVVDGQDFIAWNAHKFQATARWQDGDFNADGVVDGQDFIVWNASKFQSANSLPLLTAPESYRQRRATISHPDVEERRHSAVDHVLREFHSLDWYDPPRNATLLQVALR